MKTAFARNLAAQPSATVEKDNAGQETPIKQRVSFLSPTAVRYIVLEDITKGQRIESVDITLTRDNGEEVKRSTAALNR